MASPEGGARFAQVVIAGIPRCGTTLLATYLGSQRGCAFRADYLTVFQQLRDTFGCRYDAKLDVASRRTALLLVREEMLRQRHVVVLTETDFASLAELHRGVMAELAGPADRVVGHKVVLDARGMDALLRETAVHVLVAYRDPRDAALSWASRGGSRVDAYLARWRQYVDFIRSHEAHPRFWPIRFETFLSDPEAETERFASALGLEFRRPASLSARGRPGSQHPWAPNSAAGDVSRPFDPIAAERWRRHSDRLLVRYAQWACARELRVLGYPSPGGLTLGERLRFRAHDVGQHATDLISDGVGRLTRRIEKILPPIS